jgi:hypothetical protein
MLRGTGLRAQAAKYEYTYMEHAPYEILSSHVMSFADIIRLKRLEDVLEKYWNSHRLDHTVKYLIRHVFESPFDFFQAFGDYWEERGWQKIGHQLEDLFTRLHAFLTDRDTPSMEIITGLMKLDYFLGHKYKPRKIWWDNALEKPEWARHMKEIVAHPERVSAVLAEAGYTERELQKFMVLEVLPFRLGAVLDSISGLRADAAPEALLVTAGETAGSEGADADLMVENVPAAAVAVAEAAPEDVGGSTLLIVLYQQDESQRAQYYALPLS